MSDQSSISIRGLTKRYGRLTAVNNLDLEVRQEEILGFLGLNGAGKTTTIRILLDLLRPTNGRAYILGHDCQADGLKARSLSGYLPGEMGIYSDLTGWNAVAVAIGSVARRRSVAGGIAGLLALTMFLLDYVARAWEPAERVAWLSPFRYYEPFELLMGNALSVTSLLVLTGIATFAFALAYVLFSRRDITH